jgi:hypothetical protein
MPNTIAAQLIVDTLAAQSQTILANRLAALSNFSTDFSSDVKRPKDVIQVAVATAGSTTLTNPSSFNVIGDSTLAATAVTLNHLYQPFGLSYSDVQNAVRLERLVKINLDALADKIWSVATAPITVANFGAATVTGADSVVTPGSAQLRALWAGVNKAGRKALIVNPGIYSNLIPTSTTSLPLADGAYGFDGGVYYANLFPSEAKLAGFACSPDAIAMAAAAPALDNVRDGMLVSEVVQLEGLGMSIYYNVWADKSTRNLVASAELMFGASKSVTSGTIASIYNP